MTEISHKWPNMKRNSSKIFKILSKLAKTSRKIVRHCISITTSYFLTLIHVNLMCLLEIHLLVCCHCSAFISELAIKVATYFTIESTPNTALCSVTSTYSNNKVNYLSSWPKLSLYWSFNLFPTIFLTLTIHNPI